MSRRWSPRPADPLGVVANAAIGIADGRIVRVGKRTELAGFRAREVVALGGAWVTPGLVDCHTHLVFGGTRADEHAMRRAGATYEEIAKAGGGIASTVAATKAASADELRGQRPPPPPRADGRRGARRSRSSRATASTPPPKSACSTPPAPSPAITPVRIVTTLLALHALPPGADRDAYVKMVTDEMIPAVARAGLATSVDAFCETIAFTPAEVERVFTAARANGLAVRLHAEQLSNQNGAALAARYKALSADHLEHLDAAGAKAMAARRHRRGAASRRLLRAAGDAQAAGPAAARPPGVRSPSPPTATPAPRPCSTRQLAMNMACTLFGLTPEEALPE